MSQAFVKENDDNGMLHQIKPTIPSLNKYINEENSYTPLFVKQIKNINGLEVITMSNGFSYFINKDNNWEITL